MLKYHLSMSSKLGFRVPRWNRNDTFLRAFVKSLLFFASHRASAVGNAARDSTSWGRHCGASARGQSVWAAAEGRGGEGRPDLSNTNTGASVAGVEYSLWHWAAKAQKRQNIYNARTNVPFLLHRSTWNLSFKNMDRWSFTLRSNFPTAMNRLFGNRAKAAQIGQAVDSRCWPGMATMSTFRAPAGERHPCCSYSARSG